VFERIVAAVDESDIAERVLAATQELATLAGAEVWVLFGYAAREIMNLARERDAGVIVLGSRGRGDLAGLLVGSTAHKVIQLSDRPVIVVR
jgi:nucleotide-binding universal stress UspA family protein